MDAGVDSLQYLQSKMVSRLDWSVYKKMFSTFHESLDYHISKSMKSIKAQFN